MYQLNGTCTKIDNIKLWVRTTNYKVSDELNDYGLNKIENYKYVLRIKSDQLIRITSDRKKHFIISS